MDSDNTIRVLYVDDEPGLLEIGRLFLEQDGNFTVDTIESAPAALALLRSTPFDAIIADYHMPVMDGIEFLKAVRASGNNIPFILFTGRGREEVVIQALNEGADFYLQKGGDPIPQFMELSHKVRQAVQKRRAEGLLLESQEQLRTIFDSIPVGIVTIETKTHRILSANKTATELIAAGPDEICGRVCHEFICPADVGKCPVTDLGQQVDLSERVLLSRKEGKIPILKSVVPTILDGKDVLIESFFDISGRKRSEMAFQTLIGSMVGKTGLDALHDITTNVSRWLGTDRAVIMELTEDMKHGRILSMQPGSGIIPGGIHPIQGTPCGLAIENGFYLCPDNLQDLFPGFTMPGDFAVRSYVGLALRNSAGTVIGAVCAFSQNPLTVPPRLREIFEIIGVKAAAEIERKRTIEELRLSEERFRVLLGSVPGVAIQGYRMDGTTFFWDEGSEKTYGYTAAEALGKNLVDLIIPPEMREEVKGAIAYMAQTASPIPASDLSLMRKDGSRVAVYSSHIVLPRPHNGMELYCLDLDLTERKQAEALIQKVGREWQTTFDAITDVVYLTDETGRIVRHNLAFETFLGKSASEIEGRNCHEVMHGSPGCLPDCPIVKSQESRQRESVELNIGNQWFMVSVDPIFDAGGKIAGAVHLISDITARKRADDAIRQSEEKFRSIVETSPDMIWELDPEGRFRYISPMSRTIMGFEPEEVIGRPITDLVYDDMKNFALQELERVLASNGMVSSFEVQARHRDGHELILEIRPSRLIGADGNLAGLRGVTVDVTGRRRADNALRRANRQLSLLTGITRHDILNKISVILGFLRIAEMKSADPAITEYLKKIHAATTAIRSQIEFTRVYQDLGTHEPQWLELDAIMPRSYVPEGIALNADVKGVRLHADPLLEKVFFNLLDNTIRHGQQASGIRVSYRADGEDLVVVWEDNGVGIPAAEKERIFEYGVGKNTGVGMFLAREILALTGISIMETGEAGSGARFEIRVPRGAFRIART
ncbi:MAG TPA: PAS domain S-box protein [Methanoregula sp.]|nr:PAS domain S-box protein [Methanoregula sp.]